MLVVAVLFNNLILHRTYPSYWVGHSRRSLLDYWLRCFGSVDDLRNIKIDQVNADGAAATATATITTASISQSPSAASPADITITAGAPLSPTQPSQSPNSAFSSIFTLPPSPAKDSDENSFDV